MISYEVFQKNRSEYGQCCSWAVWDIGAPEYSRYAPDTTLPTFYLNRAVKKLNAISSAENLSNLGWTLTPDVVIVALNFAERDISAKKATQNINFHSFHEETAATSDYRLRDICLGTPLWGAYLTDLAKSKVPD